MAGEEVKAAAGTRFAFSEHIKGNSPQRAVDSFFIERKVIQRDFLFPLPIAIQDFAIPFF
jgi:hypothetical protein